MGHKVLENMHLECDVCHTVRNEPFCKVCHTFDSDVFINLRHDGIDAAAEVDSEPAGEGSDTLDHIESGFAIFE